jgi:hypothetical protein
MVSPRHRRFTPGKKPVTHCIWRLVGPLGRSGRVRKISLPPGFDSQTAQPVTSHYTDWATFQLQIQNFCWVVVISYCPCDLFLPHISASPEVFFSVSWYFLHAPFPSWLLPYFCIIKMCTFNPRSNTKLSESKCKFCVETSWDFFMDQTECLSFASPPGCNNFVTQ